MPQPATYLIENYEKETCLDKTAKLSIQKRESETGVAWANLRYILVTANNWQGPIKDFHLTIKKQEATDLVSLCFEGDLKKTSPLTFEFQQKNFKPSHDLNLLFIRKTS